MKFSGSMLKAKISRFDGLMALIFFAAKAGEISFREINSAFQSNS